MYEFRFVLEIDKVPWAIVVGEAGNPAALMDRLLDRAVDLRLVCSGRQEIDEGAECVLSVRFEWEVQIDENATVCDPSLPGTWLPCTLAVELARGHILHSLMREPDRIDEACGAWLTRARDLFWCLHGPDMKPDGHAAVLSGKPRAVRRRAAPHA